MFQKVLEIKCRCIFEIIFHWLNEGFKIQFWKFNISAKNEKEAMLQQRKLNDQTKILTWMVIVFVFCQCFTIIADIYDFICVVFSSSRVPSNIHIDNLIYMGHFMLALNSSVNFIFYILHIKAFRKHFVQVYYTLKTLHACFDRYGPFFHLIFLEVHM